MYNHNVAPPCAQNSRVPAASYDTERLIATVAAHLDVAPAAIRGNARSKEIALARLTVMYLLHEDTWHSWAEIGRLLGRDHSTVIHGHASLARTLLHDHSLRLTIEAIRCDMRSPAPATAPPAARATSRAEFFEYRYWRTQAPRRAYGGVA